ncbi:cytochrome C biogenesis protein [Candidatus Parcubacteria bacterium]|nr:MAG: cytochrome C biogenesis protein [Candidatus Parcubacteria bacterium]
MTLLIVSFIAGILTILAPCILPVLPIVLGRSVEGNNKYKPLIISGSLAVSVVIFTLLLKASTALIDIPFSTWSYISGGIIIFFGLITLFPGPWEKLSSLFKFSIKSNQVLGKSAQKKGIVGDILVGASLGPVFSSCSPTYFLIIATVLPQNYFVGTMYIIAYALGLSLMLLLIGYVGQRFASKLTSLADPKGLFKRILGILFLIVGLAIITGYDKKVEAKLLDSGFLDVTKIEQRLLAEPMDDMKDEGVEVNMEKQARMNKEQFYPQYTDIVNPSGFVNTDGITIEELIGKKVVLVDFWTYSCINCQRTMPYITSWYDKYRDEGLEIISIHTPEFAFEKKIENVIDAAERFGIEYPIVLDNDYSTWAAYKNRYWPRKYLIDIDGFVVYDHIGEGAYEQTENKMQELLEERSERIGESKEFTLDLSTNLGEKSQAKSPEIYFGSARNSKLGNGASGRAGEQILSMRDDDDVLNTLYLHGSWNIEPEYAQTVGEGNKVRFRYNADKVFMVAESDEPAKVRVMRDGVDVGTYGGNDILNSQLEIGESKLYHLIDEPDAGEHTLEFIVDDPGVRIYTFTFG